jgi:hypothetical protein
VLDAPVMRSLLASLVVLVTLTTAASASPDAPHTRNRNTAMELSVGGTMTGAAMLALGGKLWNAPLAIGGVVVVFLGPSAGEWYAGRYVTTGMLVRVAGAGALALGATHLNFSGFGSNELDASGSLLIVGGVLTIIGGAVLDIAHAGRAADEWNARHALQVAPIQLQGAHDRATGLALGGRF